MATSGIPVVLMGLGEIGRAIGRAALARPGLEIMAAVDPELAGRPLGALIGVPAGDLRVEADLGKALARARGGVVLQATRSRFEEVRRDLERIVRAGLGVVSTCEELAYPWLDHAEGAEALHRLCEEHEVAVVASGVNPGFVLDRLPGLLAQVAGEVRHVRGTRVVDAGTRREALRRKIGVGLSPEAFDAAADRDEIGHVGLVRSAALVAEWCIGADEFDTEEEIVPLLAEEDAPDRSVRRGEVVGVQQTARAFDGDREIVRLDLTIAVGADDPRDELVLDAVPPIRVVIPGGIHGDAATAHAVVNAVPALLEHQGLLTPLDLPAGR